MKRLLLVHNKNVAPVATSVRVFTYPGYRFLFSPGFIVKIFLALALLFACGKLSAQGGLQEAEYKNSIRGRVAKIVNTLSITDSARYYRIMDQVSDQYYELNVIHDQHKLKVAEIKNNQSLSQSAIEETVRKHEEKKQAQLLKLHKKFIARLRKNVTQEQVDLVKDGMTYSVLHVTYEAYLDKIPRLTEEQKSKIYAWLHEARELAMDQGSSEDKHRVFGKYKGKINNYLSAQGYDLKKEEKDWQQRLRERRKKEKA